MAITDITKPMALDETLQGTNTKMDAVILKLQGIIDALGLDTSVYKPKGNITCAALVPALLIESNIGNVYNVTDNGTTTSDFAEGAGKPIHVGDNVAIVDVGTGGQSEYKFDLLAGMVDLTNYVQKSATPGLLKNDGTIDTKDYAEKVPSATNGNLAGLNSSGNLTDSGISGDMTTTSATGNPISIADLKSAQIALNPVITFEPIQAGSGTPSPSNVRAISGYDKIEVSSGGVNVWDETWELGGIVWNTGQEIAATDRIRTGFIRAISGGTYYLYVLSSIIGSGYGVVFYNKSKERISANSGIAANSTFTTPANTAYIRLVYIGITSYTSGISVNYPSTVHDYVPYHKTTDLSESLGQTVYGGTYEPRTGKFTVDRVIATITSISGSKPNYYASVSVYPDTTRNLDIICEKMATAASYGGSGVYINNNRAIMFVTSAYETAADLLAAFGGSVDVCYAVATPIEIQLTPHEIALSQGYNYISSNGTSISMAYHNGEVATHADVEQLAETVNELGEYVEYYTGKNKSGTAVSINAYTSSSNMYTCPSDGYLVISSGSSTSGKLRAVVRGSNNSNIAFLYMNVVGDYQIQSLFVRKGMYVYLQENSVGNGSAEFHPIE